MRATSLDFPSAAWGALPSAAQGARRAVTSAARGRYALLWALAGALGCDRHPRPGAADPPPVGGRAAASAERAPSSAGARSEGSARSAEVARELRELRAAKLRLVPPRDPLGGLAVGAACVAQALADRVVFRDAASGEVFAETAFGAPRALAVDGRGGVLALGASGTALLEARGRAPRRFGHAAFFPGSRLFPDLEDAARFYVFYPGRNSVYRYGVAGASELLPIAEQHTLQDYSGALALTRDGAFVYASPGGLARSAPRGSLARFSFSGGRTAPWRLLPAERLDEVWSIAEDGLVQRLALTPGLPVKESFRLPDRPFEVAINHDALAFIGSRQTDGGPRSWALVVLDFEGRERFRSELPPPEISSDDDWFEALAKSRQLALSASSPLVVVGGSDGLSVYDYRKQAELFRR